MRSGSLWSSGEGWGIAYGVSNKEVIRYGSKGKVASRYIGPFKVLQRIGDASYKLDLPASMEKIHLDFHVPVLWKFVLDPSEVLKEPEVEISRGSHLC